MNDRRPLETFETSGGVKIFRLPLQAFPNFWAYVHVVLIDDLRILIDTGSGTDTSHDDLLNGLTQAGISPSELTHILLTHAHIDHYGGLTKLKPLTHARIGCHELDVQTVAHHEANLALLSRRIATFLAGAGLAKEEADALLAIHRFTNALPQSVPLDFTYNTINEDLPAMEVIHLPGHCPGHVALRLEDVVFCGDMVVEGVTPHISPEIITPHGGLDHYLESLNKFQVWSQRARLILNGHDPAITDLPAQIDSTHKNIVRRMGRAMEAMSEPLTMAEVCNKVYENPGGYNKLLTIEKTGAYIEYLYERAWIEIANPAEVEAGLPATYWKMQESVVDVLLPEQASMMVEQPDAMAEGIAKPPDLLK
jgi:glyoxylase-like metal-dependent hydrolase (beta-lactamase superfamily II)